jgi:penicillin-binding protein 2
VVAAGLVDERPGRERQLIRFIAFGIAALLAIGGLTARMVYLQLVSGQTYQQLATSNSTFQQAIPSTRGLIYDRNGLLLVANLPSYTVEIRPSDLPFSQRATVVAQLASLLKMDPADINAAIDGNPGSTFDLVRIAQAVPVATANLIAEEHLDLPGVEVSVDALRHYTNGPLMSEVLGYTGAIDAATLKQLTPLGYQPDDLIGLAGVEEQYETQLRGTYGTETIQRDATGRQIQVLSTDRQPVAGDSLTLTIDTKMQQQAQTAVAWAMKAAKLKSAVLIAMNPQTGEILAMVSTPTYNDNDFAQGITNAQFQALLKNPDKPLLNHAISLQFPEGSTYKLVTGSGALADKKLTPTTLVQTHPYIQIGADRFWDWNKMGFGPLNILGGFADSSDTFFYQVAEMLGIQRLAYWAHQFGFGAPTKIDLPGEVAGIVPDDQWKQATFGQAILPGELVQAGIGQGFDTSTPLQLLNAYAALANGGTLYQPQVVREITGPDGNIVRPFTPIVLHKIALPASVLTTMRVAARQVVTSQHTYNLVNEPFVVAGKTGTAEFGVRDAKGLLPYHNWFVAFVPLHGDVSKPDSQLAVVGFNEDANTVGNSATEMIKYFLQIHFGTKHDLRLFNLMQIGNFYRGGN